MIKDRNKIKEMLRSLGVRHASDKEMRDMMFGEGLTAIEIMEILDELIKEQLGTDNGGNINMDNVELVVRAMMESKMGAERMWNYLEQFGVPAELRVKLLADIRDKMSSPMTFVCTLCGENLKELTKNDRKCPKCNYHIIKILRDMKIKEGQLSKSQVIDVLLMSDEFTKEEKDMIN